jgi:uncharacterized protein
VAAILFGLRAITMLKIPGKSCGPCTHCCKVLYIEELKKPAGPICSNCIVGGGCAIYDTRPPVCRDYECQWLWDRNLPATMRPDKVGTLLMDDPDSDEYHAVCEIEKPFAWRNPLVFKHLVSMAKSGRVVVAKSGLRAWRIFDDGRWGEWA